VSVSVFESDQSVVFDEAENRIHAQKSVLLWCFGELQQGAERNFQQFGP
jgi:ornithine carbamoyltransferase